MTRFLGLTPKGPVGKADSRHVDLPVNAFNFAESGGVGTPGVKQPNGENEESKSLDIATFGIGEAENQNIAPCSEPGDATGSVHLTRVFWAGESTDESITTEMVAARLTSQKDSVRFARPACQII